MKPIAAETLKVLLSKEYKPTVNRNLRQVSKVIPDEMTFEQLKRLWWKIAGKDFQFTDENKPIINMLIAYFLMDDKILEYPEINPFKGILLIGKKGCGKTTIMNVFAKFLDEIFNQDLSTRKLLITSIDRIKQYYLLNGNLDKFTYNDIGGPCELVINEFGYLYDSNLYGTPFKELISNLFMLRYELFSERGILTHATSNLSARSDNPKDLTLEKIYDPIIYDRLKEMFNTVILNGESWRK
jgi:hypothetical protein